MEQEKFIKESLKEFGVKKAPDGLLPAVMSEIEAKDLKSGYRPLVAPWLIWSVLITFGVLLSVLLYQVKDVKSIIHFPRLEINFPELNFDFTSLLLPAVFAGLLLILVDVFSRRAIQH